jgi:hypothetical protein
MNIEIFYNADFPIIMTARADGRYPLVHAVLQVEITPPRLVVEFRELWMHGKNTVADVKKVRDKLIKEVFDSFEHHRLVYKIEDKYYTLTRGILNKYGPTMIAVEE